MAGNSVRRNEGFSLIEVLVALVILAVGLLALAVFQITAIRGNAVASKWTVATELAQDRLERFRHAPWENIASSPSGGFNPGTPPTLLSGNLPAAAGDNTTIRGVTYYRVWHVASNPTNTLKTITVWSCWRDEAANWHNVMLVLQRANVGGT